MIERAYGLSTDLYELTMAAAYFENGLSDRRAVFELFVRRLPPKRSFLIAAGLEQALDFLATLRFTEDQIDYLREHPSFRHVSREFFDYLRAFRFTGDVWAMPEGTAAFANQPLVRVHGPIIEAQLVETFLLSVINFETLVASKAARLTLAAGGRAVVEFGTRRAHGSEAGMLAARAAFIGGCAGTSNVEAGFFFGIPTSGTLAHSFVMLFEEEDDAFRAFLRTFPEGATILVDTYDTLRAVERLAGEMKAKMAAVRLDSGDLTELSKRARAILDRHGMGGTKIFASSDLNEYRIAELLAAGARIDAFGVGTELATSYDAPALGGVYKLVGLETGGRMEMRAKLSADKATYPGAKQVWRRTDERGVYAGDVVALAGEAPPASDWRPLLEAVMRDGRPLEEQLPVGGAQHRAEREKRLARAKRAQSRAAEELRRLPGELLTLDGSGRYPVRVSETLQAELDRLRREKERAKS